jgi:acyl-CoA thioesterase-2
MLSPETPTSPGTAGELARELLAPEPLGHDRFAIDVSAHIEGHLFGGLVAAQSLHAGFATVDPARRAQSMHAYFLRPGRPELPIEFEVHRDTDGRSFSARRVAAIQAGKPIFTMVCSFHVPEETGEQLRAIPPVATRPPEPGDVDIESDLGGLFELRRDLVDGDDHVDRRVGKMIWVRAVGALPDDPVIHDCLLLCASDMGTPWHVARPDDMHVGPSLDHSVWFHRRTRLDAWHHLSHEPEAMADGRGLYTGRIWSADGAQVATVAQENLLRPISG